MWSFADPWLLLLLPVPLLVHRFAPPARDSGAALRVPEGIARRFSLVQGMAGLLGDTRRMLPVLVWVCLVAAIAGPRQIVPNLAAPTSGREIVLALDLSGSMVTRDFDLDGRTSRRIDAVKRVASAFVRGRGGDRLALVLFGSKAYFATPQTYDVEAVASAIEEAVIGISGRATAIGDALGLSLKRLDGSDADIRVVILLSDGINNSGPVRPRDAARLAADKDIRVHTIAMGPAQGEDSDAFDAVDVAELQAVAEISGGRSFHVRTTEDLVAVADEIDRLESRSAEGPRADLYRDLWLWPAGAALLGLLALIALRFREGG